MRIDLIPKTALSYSGTHYLCGSGFYVTTPTYQPETVVEIDYSEIDVILHMSWEPIANCNGPHDVKKIFWNIISGQENFQEIIDHALSSRYNRGVGDGKFELRAGIKELLRVE